MAPKATVERTMVVPNLDGLEDDVRARSTILTWMIWSKLQVPGLMVLIHRTKYCLPQAAPLSHIPSPAAAKKLLDGNWAALLPLQAVAVSRKDVSMHVFISGKIQVQNPVNSYTYKRFSHIKTHLLAGKLGVHSFASILCIFLWFVSRAYVDFSPNS